MVWALAYTFYPHPGPAPEPPEAARPSTAVLGPLKLQCLNRIDQQIAVCIWVSYVTSCYVTSCSVCPGSSVALGGGGSGGGGGQTIGVLWGTGIGQLFFSIRKQHSVDKVHTLRYSVSKISEYKSRCCFFLLF